LQGVQKALSPSTASRKETRRMCYSRNLCSLHKTTCRGLSRTSPTFRLFLVFRFVKILCHRKKVKVLWKSELKIWFCSKVRIGDISCVARNCPFGSCVDSFPCDCRHGYWTSTRHIFVLVKKESLCTFGWISTRLPTSVTHKRKIYGRELGNPDPVLLRTL
jgi:hypothetical protein